MSEMIERVAKAIHGYRDKPIPWDRCAPTYQVELRKQAKAAIEAMKEPTEEMLEAGAYDLDIKLSTQYQNMINKALEE